MYELIIIGGGPAGMTAAVYAARKKLNTLLLTDDIGGQVLWNTRIENYMGYQFIEGPELIQRFEEQMRQFPIETRIGDSAADLSHTDEVFAVSTEKGETYHARAVIAATGKRPRHLNVPGEEKLRGRGVTYCAICDGPLFAGESVAVVGGGDSALGAADDMAKIAEHVYLISTTPLTGTRVLIDRVTEAGNLTTLVEHEVVEIKGENSVEKMSVRDLITRQEKELGVGAVFIEIGLIPNSEPFRKAVGLNDKGEIEVSCANETGVAGLFAAGDVTNVPAKQIVVATGEGAKASLQAHRYLQTLSR